jgi:hypothetical protein
MSLHDYAIYALKYFSHTHPQEEACEWFVQYIRNFIRSPPTNVKKICMVIIIDNSDLSWDILFLNSGDTFYRHYFKPAKKGKTPKKRTQALILINTNIVFIGVCSEYKPGTQGLSQASEARQDCSCFP